jgi:GTP diphosphokinase / guanosine-3',5'-bis(diphosphate) 3'-diphosphatase
VALGRGDIGPSAVLRELTEGQEEPGAKPATFSPLRKLADRLRRAQPGVRIQGLDNLMVRYSQCCQPVPGDDVIGYITVGRGVSIHRKDCPNVLGLSQDPDRRVEIEWTAEKGERFMVKLYTRGTDRQGLLSDIAKAISDTGTNIQHADIRGVEDGMLGEFVVEVRDLDPSEEVGQVKVVLSAGEGSPFGGTPGSFGLSDLLERFGDRTARIHARFQISAPYEPKGDQPRPSGAYRGVSAG